LFRLQDEVLKRNLLERELLPNAAALSSLVSVCYQALEEMRFSAEKQEVVRRFACDTLSHIVTAARVGLWGALPESHSVLRGAIESCAQLAFVVSQNQYKTLIEEAKRRRFQEYSFRQACKKLGERGTRLMNLHSRFSDSFSHSTPKRFRQLGYEFEGEAYDRIGSAADPVAAQLCIHSSLVIAGELVRCLMETHLQEGQNFLWGEQVAQLLEFVESLQRTQTRAETSKGPAK
jgi:hypothetical protein